MFQLSLFAWISAVFVMDLDSAAEFGGR